MKQQFDKSSLTGWRKKFFEIIFEADTPAGKLFDVVLMINIIASVLVVMLDSVSSLNARFGVLFFRLEWFFTILFTIEYIFRLICVIRPIKYACSFFGVIDLLAILPTYVNIILPGSHYFLVVRLLRVLRVFRVLKFARCLGEANMLMQALIASRRKIFVFMFAVLTLVVIIGSMIYVIEDAENGFTSIPRSVYWAIVTLTTVGYGDISPQTPLGQLLASCVMIMGYAIIAVPTGIITVEMAKYENKHITSQVCPECTQEGHDHDAKHCKFCGCKL